MWVLKKEIELCKKITLLDLTHMMSMSDLVAIIVETPRIDSGCSFEKEFIQLFHLNS